MHDCAAKECEVRVPDHVLMCKPHWYKVSRQTRTRVYRTWRRGRPTTDYPDAVRDAVAEAAT